MKTGIAQQKNNLERRKEKRKRGEMNENNIVASGIEGLFRSENIKDGLSQLSTLKTLPQVCVIDLDFYDNNILAQLQELRTQYPTIKLVSHSDIDTKKVVNPLLERVFASYLLIGSDADDFKKAIESVSNG